MFDIAELSAFVHGFFTICNYADNYLELVSHMTNHMWLIKKFDDDKFPPMVLYHSHSIKEPYHVHCVYDNDNALLCYCEINSHDKLITKRKKLKKLTHLSNKQLIEAIHL